ncbi:MAG: 4-alpha-glucanotransferase [Clostridia bacterium]
MKRSFGILLHITSLPSRFGCGSLGREAFEFADFLSKADVSYWQILPITPAGFSDSPYQCFSAFAGDTIFLDLDALVKVGLLRQAEIDNICFGTNNEKVNFESVRRGRDILFRIAFSRADDDLLKKVEQFAAENDFWLDDYSLFMAIKRHFSNKSFLEWDTPYKNREPDALAYARNEFSREIIFVKFLQYLFFEQWGVFKEYLKEKGIRLLGDMPIYVALDSADVWANPSEFLLDQNKSPIVVAGVPPDYFSPTGQLWGNPIYNWNKMRENGFSWWKNRMSQSQRLFDAVRIDHFRGFESYFAIPYGDETAEHGSWEKGPCRDFIDMLKNEFSGFEIIAEDLGLLTDEVRDMLRFSGFPGMKVLEFAFDYEPPSDYLPHNYTENCVCYTGTHDNNTLSGWLTELDGSNMVYMSRYFGLNESEGYLNGILRGGMASVAYLFIAQMQDLLGLGRDARMNTPGTTSGNWVWRLKSNALTDRLAYNIAGMVRLYGRGLK